MNEPRFAEVLAELQAMRDAKGEGYDVSVPYENVRGAKDWGLSPWFGAALRAGDKLKRLQAFFKHGSLPFESVEDAFLDLATYAVIGLILFREEQEQQKQSTCGMVFRGTDTFEYACDQRRGHGGACRNDWFGSAEDLEVNLSGRK